MKKVILLSLITLFFISIKSAEAQNISSTSAVQQAAAFWNADHNKSEFLVQPFVYNGFQSAWLIINTDKRFVIVSADSLLQPILAYGDSIKDMNSDEFIVWQKIFASDYRNRIEAVHQGFIPPEKTARAQTDSPLFEQWPPAGTTPTGGWLSTNWTQTSPYNKLCPMDLNAGNRSIVGCPATAMAQICNYYKTVNRTQFSDDDDYYHNFGNDNKYWIDNAHAERDFPDFPRLNYWLDTLQKRYDLNLSITDSMKAALSFAAGVAAHSVYSASVSGTYGIDQAQMAYQRFDFDLSELLIPPSFGLTGHVAEDMKAGLVDHLGIVDAAVSVGHNVVVDGYNTDSFYHFNFGWGGAYNGWYTLPPSGMPYNLNVIEGVVVSIKNTYADTKPSAQAGQDLNFAFINSGELQITGIKDPGMYSIKVFNSCGSLLKTGNFTGNTNNVLISTPGLSPGIYFFVVETGKTIFTGKAVKL